MYFVTIFTKKILQAFGIVANKAISAKLLAF